MKRERVLFGVSYAYTEAPSEEWLFPARRTSRPSRSGPTEDGRKAECTARRGRILVVEDDWFIGQDIEATLRQGGYTVVDLVVSADEAVAAAARERPDLVVMDIRLVGPRDGVDAAIEVRQRFDIPSLFVSAYDSPGLKARAASARPAGWLVKPVPVNMLLSTIKGILGSP